MSSEPRRIPLTLRLAVRLLPRDAREEVLGDLVEAWRERCQTKSWWARARWTASQPWAALRARWAQGRSSRRGSARAAAPVRSGRPAHAVPWAGTAGVTVRRDARRPPVPFSWLDVKLGVRMLAKQPVLTVVAGLTLALGIPSSLMPAHVMSAFSSASFPVEDGERILGIRNWNVEANAQDPRALHDFTVWREELRSFETVAAAHLGSWNVHSADGRVAGVRGAEVSASVFDMLRVPPLMGRTLIAADEVEGASDVAVISEDLWASRFARDPDIVGRVIGIGRTPHTIVGVMPAGFLFPVLEQLWLPLRADPSDYAVGAGPELHVLGRLHDDASIEQARAEVETVGVALAAELPETHAILRPEIVTIPLRFFGSPALGITENREMLFLQFLCLALLAVACGNVGILMLARTATRTNELAVRTALGASRGRILAQLFVEALVLALGATALGLILAQIATNRFAGVIVPGPMPYWLDLGLGPRSILLALGLGAVCAVAAGVLPAVKATSPRIQRNLQRTAAGATLRFGPLTALLVVAEVALSVGFLSFGTAAVVSFARDRTPEAGLDVDRYVLASLHTPWVEPTEAEAEGHAAEFRVRIGESHQELRNRLAADPAVRRVAMGMQLPGIGHPDRPIVLIGDGDASVPRTLVPTARVHVDYFRDMGIDIVAGRGFSSADVAGDPEAHRPAVIVNEQFVERVFHGGEAVGRRIRYAYAEGVCIEQPQVTPGEPAGCESHDAWYEIVGVVETFGTNMTNPDRSEALFHPMGAADLHPMRYIVEVDGDIGTFLPRLRRIAAEVDPSAMVQGVETLAERVARRRTEMRVISFFIFGLSAMGMILAATGLYALMTFTVTQRTREIGIRTALGAGARDVVATIARRALLQLVVGLALGSGLGWWIVDDITTQSEFVVRSPAGLLTGVAAAVMIFSVLACLKPTLRGLRIEPTEALREA